MAIRKSRHAERGKNISNQNDLPDNHNLGNDISLNGEDVTEPETPAEKTLGVNLEREESQEIKVDEKSTKIKNIDENVNGVNKEVDDDRNVDTASTNMTSSSDLPLTKGHLSPPITPHVIFHPRLPSRGSKHLLMQTDTEKRALNGEHLTVSQNNYDKKIFEDGVYNKKGIDQSLDQSKLPSPHLFSHDTFRTPLDSRHMYGTTNATSVPIKVRKGPIFSRERRDSFQENFVKKSALNSSAILNSNGEVTWKISSPLNGKTVHRDGVIYTDSLNKGTSGVNGVVSVASNLSEKKQSESFFYGHIPRKSPAIPFSIGIGVGVTSKPKHSSGHMTNGQNKISIASSTDDTVTATTASIMDTATVALESKDEKMNESTAMEIQDAEAKLENPAWKDSVEASTIFEPFSKNKHLYQINLGGDPNRKQTKFVQLRGKFVAIR